MSSNTSSNVHRGIGHLGAVDPYRVFFPLGVVLGIVGVGVWPLYSLGILEAIHSQAHIDLQLQGFLFAFILGFLLTAIPRFSKTSFATKRELVCFASLFILGNGATLAGFFLIGRLCFFISLLSLMVFAGRRFVKRQANPPNQFIFVGAGIVVGLIASMIRILHLLEWVNFEAIDDFVGRRLLSEGMTTLLVLGIGAKLIPMFFGFESFLASADQKQNRRQRAWFAFLALVVIASFFMEAKGLEKIALYSRAVVVSIVLLFHMKIWKKLKTKGVSIKAIKISCWAILLSFWGSVIHPQYRIEVLHVMFISGFGILIMCIATRVILSHGDYPVEHEKTSKTLLVGSALLLLSMLARSISSLFPVYYFFILGLAGTLWIFGLGLWGVEYCKKAIFPNR